MNCKDHRDFPECKNEFKMFVQKQSKNIFSFIAEKETESENTETVNLQSTVKLIEEDSFTGYSLKNNNIPKENTQNEIIFINSDQKDD